MDRRKEDLEISPAKPRLSVQSTESIHSKLAQKSQKPRAESRRYHQDHLTHIWSRKLQKRIPPNLILQLLHDPREKSGQVMPSFSFASFSWVSFPPPTLACQDKGDTQSENARNAHSSALTKACPSQFLPISIPSNCAARKHAQNNKEFCPSSLNYQTQLFSNHTSVLAFSGQNLESFPKTFPALRSRSAI